MYHTDDTIAALASPAVESARAIVRMSGPRVVSILDDCFTPTNNSPLLAITQATVVEGSLALAGAAGRNLPASVYLWPDERSYTRQPAAEIHLCGAAPLAAATLRTVCARGARPAEPGEFTLRAFLSGRLDLTQAEAVLGVIDAQGTTALQRALAQLAGGLSRPLAALRTTLLELLAHLEAGLDFVEEDIEFITRQELGQQISVAQQQVARLRHQLTIRGRHDALPRVVLVGWPNVGKSRLFNALADQGQALVSDQAGTTRDYLATVWQLPSMRCELIDTAGHEPAQSPAASRQAATIGQLAQQQTLTQTEQTTLRLMCLDATREPNDWERKQLDVDSPRLTVWTKCDRMPSFPAPPGDLVTSAATGQGLSELALRVEQALRALAGGETSASLTAERCADSLAQAEDALVRAGQLAGSSADELVAAELRLALGELGKVAGTVYTDDILDRIFSRFCIGK